MPHLEKEAYSKSGAETSQSNSIDLVRTKSKQSIEESRRMRSPDTSNEQRGDNTSPEGLTMQGTDSHSSSFDVNSRLISPKYYPTKELRAEARKVIRDIKQQLLNEDGGNETSQERIRKLYNRLPEQEVDKWQKLLKKGKENRTTLFKNLSEEHLKQLNQGIKDIKKVEVETVKLIGFIKDVSRGPDTLRLKIKSNDIIRRMAGKSTPKNLDYAKAIDKIPKELRGLVFQRLQEYQGQGIWQDMKNKYMKIDPVDNKPYLDNKPLANLLEAISSEEMKVLVKVPEHRNVIPADARNAYATAFREVMQATGHKDIFE